MQPRHFLTLLDFSADELHKLILRAVELKQLQHNGKPHTPLQGKTLAMIFEKSSTRTRVSFEAGMAQLGGHALFLSPNDTQLGRGEPVEDSARVISRMVDVVMMRTFEHEKLEQFAAHSHVPVINGLTDLFHPCQLLADILTFHELRGGIRGCTVAWIGDGNNMCNSYINATRLFDFKLRIACPQGYEPDAETLRAAGNRVELSYDPVATATAADLIATDVWASMGQESEKEQRRKDFAEFQVNEALMSRANNDALFMHCLPAHRGEEVSSGVLDSPQSVVWEEAENRLHAQKALLEMLLVENNS